MNIKYDLIGTITGIIGAILIALNIGLNSLGYVLFLISASSYVIYSMKIKNKNLFFLNMTFIIINIIGLLRYQ